LYAYSEVYAEITCDDGYRLVGGECLDATAPSKPVYNAIYHES
jgi:hypothetical protein